MASYQQPRIRTRWWWWVSYERIIIQPSGGMKVMTNLRGALEPRHSITPGRTVRGSSNPRPRSLWLWPNSRRCMRRRRENLNSLKLSRHRKRMLELDTFNLLKQDLNRWKRYVSLSGTNGLRSTGICGSKWSDDQMGWQLLHREQQQHNWWRKKWLFRLESGHLPRQIGLGRSSVTTSRSSKN